MISIYLAGPVDNDKEKNYYQTIADMVPVGVPVTLFRPGIAFKTNHSNVDPEYIVYINKVAMLNADITVFYVNTTPTVGTWCEMMLQVFNPDIGAVGKKCVFYSDPNVRVGVYMRWLSSQFKTDWVHTHKALEERLTKIIYEKYNERIGVNND